MSELAMVDEEKDVFSRTVGLFFDESPAYLEKKAAKMGKSVDEIRMSKNFFYKLFDFVLSFVGKNPDFE